MEFVAEHTHGLLMYHWKEFSDEPLLLTSMKSHGENKSTDVVVGSPSPNATFYTEAVIILYNSTNIHLNDLAP